MKPVVFIHVLLVMGLLSGKLKAQDTLSQKHWDFRGYISASPSASFTDPEADWTIDALLHNRLEFGWFPVTWLSAEAAMRNRFFYGETVKNFAAMKEQTAQDPGWADLSRNLTEGNDYLLNVAFDRAFVKLSSGRLEFTAGRQRINWGQTFVWNPNDIFNTYSYYDVDYPERPGSDAFRLQYYTGASSSLEAAAKWDSSHQVTAAFLVRFNKAGFDGQLLAGILNQQDVVFGAGWTGNIGGSAIRGEVSYFHPKDHFRDTTGILALSVGWDYVFSNSLSIQLEGFYNQDASPGTASGMGVFDQPASPKMLSFTDYNLLAQVSYPFTPLFSGSLAVIWFPDIEGYYLTPCLEYSLLQSLDLSLFLQIFRGEMEQQSGPYKMTFYEKVNRGLLRLKWSF